MGFGPRLLRQLRTKLSLSQEQLASQLQVSFATVNRWEGGRAQPQKAQLEALEKLVEEAGLSEQALDDATERPDTRRGRRGGVTKSKVLSTKSMEQMLWDAACSIRGEKDAPKFKDY